MSYKFENEDIYCEKYDTPSDLEKQYSLYQDNYLFRKQQQKINENIVIKSILKKSNDYDIHLRSIELRIKKIGLIIKAFILFISFIILDIYFSLYNRNCVKDNCELLNISMETYLIFSSLSTLFILILYTLYISCIYKNDSDLYNISFYKYLMCVILMLIKICWNIIGIFIYYEKIYNNTDNCNKNILTYLLVSIIIKLILNLFIIANLFVYI